MNDASFRTCHPTKKPYLGKKKGCIVDGWNGMAGRSTMLFEIDIYECPVGEYCKQFGDRFPMLGYVW